MNINNLIEDIKYFYQILNLAENTTNGKQILGTKGKPSNFPDRGVYFFFEPVENRCEFGSGFKVIRVGTHALRLGSKSSLWDRLRQHKGYVTGRHPLGGNHRGSIFRKHVGNAIINKNKIPLSQSENWGCGSSSSKEIRDREYPIEIEVSKYIRSLPFIWMEIYDPSGPESVRGYIERNSIGLLSNCMKYKIDQPGPNWLGFYTNNSAIISSGLWNVNHVSDEYDSSFLEVLRKLI